MANGAGVDVAHRVDEADHPAGPAELSPGSAEPNADR